MKLPTEYNNVHGAAYIYIGQKGVTLHIVLADGAIYNTTIQVLELYYIAYKLIELLI